jgi:hypothetical protein
MRRTTAMMRDLEFDPLMDTPDRTPTPHDFTCDQCGEKKDRDTVYLIPEPDGVGILEVVCYECAGGPA